MKACLHRDFGKGFPDSFENEGEEETRQPVEAVRHRVHSGEHLVPDRVADSKEEDVVVALVGPAFHFVEIRDERKNGSEGSDDEEEDAESERERADVAAARRIGVLFVVGDVGIVSAASATTSRFCDGKRGPRRAERKATSFGRSGRGDVADVDDPLEIEGELEKQQHACRWRSDEALVQRVRALVFAAVADDVGDDLAETSRRVEEHRAEKKKRRAMTLGEETRRKTAHVCQKRAERANQARAAVAAFPAQRITTAATGISFRIAQTRRKS